MDPLPVSVVIPAYRRPEMVERAIRSALQQRPRPAEVLVVDDASGDQTAARARASGARVIVHERNQGEGPARNTGIAAANKEWIALLDSDDEWLPGHLATLWAHRNGHVLVGAAALTTAPGSSVPRISGWAGRRPRVVRRPGDAAVPENKFNATAVMVRRSTVLAAGGFGDGSRAADMDLWLRMLEQGTGVAVPRVTALWHVHPGQASGERGPMRGSHGSVLASYSDRTWCTPSLLRRCEGALAWDDMRAALADDSPPRRWVVLLLRALGSPQRALGVAELLAGRFWARRLATRAASESRSAALTRAPLPSS